MGNAEIETLNIAIENMLAGKPQAEIIAHLGKHTSATLPLLEIGKEFRFLSYAPLPAGEQLRADKAAFMRDLAVLPLDAVSPSLFNRLKEWAVTLRQSPSIAKNGGKRMFQDLVLKAAMIIAMALSSTGVGTILAKESLPGTLFYPVKMALEQGQESITTNPADKADFELVRAQNRLQELARLMEGAGDSHGQTALAAQIHLEQSLQLAAGLSDEEMIPLLERIRQMTSEQLQQWTQYENSGSESVQQHARLIVQLLSRTRTQAEEGLNDPQTWRLRYGHGTATATPEPNPSPTPMATEEPGGIISGTMRSECDSTGCEPIGDKNMYGPQPDQPGPGQPGGNPDGTCVNGDDCVPDGDQHQYGRQEESSASSSGDCTDSDCELERNQNQYGSQSADSSSSSVSPCENGGCQQQGNSSASSAGSENQNGNSSSSSSSAVQNNQDGGNGDSGGSNDSGGGNDSGGSSDGGSSPKSGSGKSGKGK